MPHGLPALPTDGQVAVGNNDITYQFSAALGSWIAKLKGEALTSVSSPNIVDGEVKTADIAAGAVTLAKLAADILAEMSTYVKRDGSRTMTAPLDAGGQKVTNLATGTANSDAVRLDQLNAVQGQVTTVSTVVTALSAAETGNLKSDGSRALTGNLDAGGQSIVGLRAATANGEAVRYDEYAATAALTLANTASISTLTSSSVAKTGDTMTGPLQLPAAVPVAATEATNKAYVDAMDAALQLLISNEAIARAAGDAARLPLTGGAMTGPLILSTDATAALEAVTKQQLEAAIVAASSGDVKSDGSVAFASPQSGVDGTVAAHLATKGQVDAAIATAVLSVNDAGEIAVAPTGNLSSTNVQAALQELQGDADTSAAAIAAEAAARATADALLVSISAIVNDLTTGGTAVPLSAQQGVALKALVDAQAAGYTAADVLAKLLTVDGAASALDADLLDGQHGAYYQDASNLSAGVLAVARMPALTGGDVTSAAGDGTLTIGAGRVTGTMLAAGAVAGALGFTPLDASAYTAADVLAKLLTVDGAGTGLDADTLDGVQLSALVQASQIVNDLTTGGTNVPLSAEQGKVLNQLILSGVGTSTVYGTLAARDADVSVNDGDIAYVTNYDGAGHWAYYVRVSGSWILMLDQVSLGAAVSGSLQKDGSVTATGNLPMGGHKITGLAAATANGDAVRFEQVSAVGYSGSASDIASGTLATARLDAGTGANQIVQLDGSARLPAVDGSQLTGVVVPGPSFAAATETPANWTYLTKPVFAQVLPFSGAVAGTPLALATIAGITKIVGVSGWVGDGTNQYPIGASGSAMGGGVLVKLTGTTVTIDTGVSGIDRGEVKVDYAK